MSSVGAIDEPLAGVGEPADAVERGVTLVIHHLDVPQVLQVACLAAPMEHRVVAQLVDLSHDLTSRHKERKW